MAIPRPCALVLALVLLAPASAFAQARWGQPVLRDGKCSVPPDPAWSEPEKFVWEKACAGHEANFNEAEGHTLDPNKPEEWPNSRILRSAFLETILLDEKYSRVLTRRGVRIKGARFTDRIDLENARIEHELWLDQSLLEKGADFSGLSSNEPISLESSKAAAPVSMAGAKLGSTLRMRGIDFAELDLSNAHVAGTLDLSNAAKVTGRLTMSELHATDSIYMQGSQFREVSLWHAHVGGMLSLDKTKIKSGVENTKARLDMNEIRVDGSLYMSDRSEFEDVALNSARIGGLLDLETATVSGTLEMDKLQVASSLFMRKGAKFRDVVLTGARIGGSLDMSDRSEFTGPVNMSSAHIASSVYMGDGSRFAAVTVISAQIGGTLELAGANVSRLLDMDKVQVASSLFMRKTEKFAATFAEVNLTSARVGGILSLAGANVTGELTMYNLRVASDLYMNSGSRFRNVNLVGARVGGTLELGTATVAGQLAMDNLEVASNLNMRRAELSGPVAVRFARLGHLDLAGAKFQNDVDLTGTQIVGELRVGSSENPARWSEQTTLIVRNARADSIQDLWSSSKEGPQTWPSRLELSGFMYRNIGGIAGTQDFMDMANRPPEWFKDWLGRQQSHSPAPYEHLAAVLRTQGRPEIADEILFEKKERERANVFERFQKAHGRRAAAALLDYGALTASRWFIGYGYHLWWVLWWIGGVLLVGVLFLQLSGEGPRNGMPYGIAYSFDMLLPIIRLRDHHYKIDLNGRTRWYFYIHKILGYVLASFLIAGISGLTK